jgi:hypothetical protein
MNCVAQIYEINKNYEQRSVNYINLSKLVLLASLPIPSPEARGYYKLKFL